MSELKPQKNKKKGKQVKFQAVKGTKDVLPSEQNALDYVLKTSRKLGEDFGFLKIETPIIEYTNLYKRSTGENTDIVSKEMFSFETHGKDKISLRPEGTPGIVRAYIENGMNKWQKPVKLYYEGKMFRYENPQYGRQREFHQVGFEVFGDKFPSSDAQLIYLAWKIIQKIGIKNIAIQINSIGCKNCRSYYKNLLVDYYKKKLKKLCPDCKKRLKKNPLRVLDCKEEKCLQVSLQTPQIADHICNECKNHFKSVLEFLDEVSVKYVLNHHLVRGLDYYTKTIFEIYEENLEFSRQSSLGGGGRYDDLVKILGGEDTPAAGFAIGVERVINKMLKSGFNFDKRTKKQVFLVQLGKKARKKSFKIFGKLINSNITVGESFGRDSIKSQLRLANKAGVKLSLIIGQKEAIDNTVIIRYMDSGIQETVMADKIVSEVKKRLKK